MCSAAIAFAAISGVGTAMADRQAQMAQWSAQVNAVNRSNAIAKQNYQQNLSITKYKEERKGEVWKAKLAASAAERTGFFKQLQINQLERDRASTANQLKLREKYTEAAFEGQTKLAESIRASGTILASGMPVGNSLLSELTQVERELGFLQAGTRAGLEDANTVFAISEYGSDLAKYSADSRATNELSATPITPGAEFAPLAPIYQKAPSKPSMLGSIMRGVTTGVMVGSGIGHSSGVEGTPWWKV